MFDYEKDVANNALVHIPVEVELQYSGALFNSPQLIVENVKQVATTDGNGYWQVNVVANANPNLTPQNTVYSVATPYRRFQVSIPTGAGPFQASANLANAVSTLSPAATGLTGPITVTGNETVTGNLTVQGTTTLQTGATVTGGETLTGGLTLTDPASQIVPGSTSMSLRNHANSADNLLLSDAGAATIRAGLTVAGGSETITAGDLTLSAGKISLGATASRIVPGATSLSLRNNVNTADNVLVADSGAVTTRSTLTVSAGGASITGNASVLSGNLTLNGRLIAASGVPTTSNANANIANRVVAGFDLAHRITFDVVTGTITSGTRLFTVTLSASFPTSCVPSVTPSVSSGISTWNLDLNAITANSYDVLCSGNIVVGTSYVITAVVSGY